MALQQSANLLYSPRMTIARVILTIPALSLAAAEDIANRFENDFRIDPVAVTINETDEAKNLWETVAYFATETEARETQQILQLSSGLISNLPDIDLWLLEDFFSTAPMIETADDMAACRSRSMRALLLAQATMALQRDVFSPSTVF
jgi:hypothetical protein